MKKHGWLFVAVVCAAIGAASCGDDDGGSTTPPPPPPGDGAVPPPPTDGAVPPPSGGSCPGDIGGGVCCATASNADRQDAPELRLVGINISAPSALSNAAIISLVQGAIDGQRFNWLMRLSGADGDGEFTIETGAGERNSDGTYAFLGGEYPPQMFMGTLAGETWMTGSAAMTVSIPVFNDDGSLLTVLPLDGLQVDTATLSEMRDCIGTRSGRRWTYGSPESALTAYITVASAREVQIEALGMDLCSLLAGTNCMMPQSAWMNPPTAVCNGGACSGACDGTDNCAYEVNASFAAAAVEIQ
ncbi:MAG: hypothetical protein IT379_28460 [Deltaproteobacteria bacterium]|nr:hypothetical protein [Deltaproteobacteria bacterium]